MVRGDVTALDEMDISSDGFWRSFAAMLFVLPALFFSWAMDTNELISLGVTHSKPYIIAIQMVIELIMWLLPIIFLALAIRFLGFANRYAHLIIVRNWLAVPLYYVIAVTDIIDFTTRSEDMAFALTFIILIAMIIISIRLTRMCLECSSSMAMGLVVFEMLMLFPLAFWLYEVAGITV